MASEITPCGSCVSGDHDQCENRRSVQGNTRPLAVGIFGENVTECCCEPVAPRPRYTPPTIRERLIVGPYPFSLDEIKAIAAFGGVPQAKVEQIVRMTTQACREAWT